MSSIHCSSEVDVTREEEEDKVDLISSPTKSSANVNMKFTSTPNIPGCVFVMCHYAVCVLYWEIL